MMLYFHHLLLYSLIGSALHVLLTLLRKKQGNILDFIMDLCAW